MRQSERSYRQNFMHERWVHLDLNTVKLGNKERFDKKQIGIKEPFPVTNCQFTS